MARQMGCTTELILKWEAGTLQPESEAMNHLHYLKNNVENSSDQILQTPVAENHMELRGLSQLTHRDLLKDN